MNVKLSNIKMVRIKDVAELDPETLGESTSPEFSFKYIDLSSVKSGRISNQVEQMTFQSAPGRARKLVKHNDILLGMVRPYLKPFAKVQALEHGYVASTGFAVIRAKAGTADSEYLYQTIWSDGISKQIQQMVTGSNYPALSVGDVKDIKIPLPPLAEQRKIAEILRTWDEAIETAESELKLKQDRKRWIMKTLLSSSAEQPGSLSLHGCPKVKLQEICDVEWGNSELTKSSYIQNGKYLAVSAAGCDGRIDHSEHKKNTPVISAIGANCGRMFLPSEDFTAIKNTITITPKESIADGRYLYETLTFLELPKRGGAQPFMSKGDIDNFKIPLPTLQHQKKIADVLRSTEADIEFIKTRIEALQNQKRGLMQKLLTGEIRVAV